jgi:hypothetical protein
MFSMQAPQPQSPHESVLPQPSPTWPHWIPISAQLLGVHPQVPAAPAPPQVSGGVQVPHWRELPQPSSGVPQLNPSCAHVCPMQPLDVLLGPALDAVPAPAPEVLEAAVALTLAVVDAPPAPEPLAAPWTTVLPHAASPRSSPAARSDEGVEAVRLMRWARRVPARLV